MNPLKKLFGQTAVYGFGTVVPRLLNYILLTPFFTRIFKVGEYGIVTELYAFVVFLLIILTFGMETAFFRFAQTKNNVNRVFSTSLIFLFATSSLFILNTWIFSDNIAAAIGYASNPEYIMWIGIIVGIDAFTAIPFARIRWENKALRFAMIKIAGVVLNIFLNFSFLYLIPKAGASIPLWLERIYSPSIGVGYVFISNIAASSLTLVLLSATLFKMEIRFSIKLWKEMLKYSFPLLISGLAGTVACPEKDT